MCAHLDPAGAILVTQTCTGDIFACSHVSRASPLLVRRLPET
jgi:hypothetical protein